MKQISFIQIFYLKRKLENFENIMICIYNPMKRQKEFIEEIYVQDFIKNNEVIREYSKTINLGENLEIIFKLSISIIDSFFIYKKNKSLKLEGVINEKKEELETLNNCLSHIDVTLGKYFLNNSKNQNTISPLRDNNDPFHNLDIIMNNNDNTNQNLQSKYLSNDFHYTEKVENYFLKIIGKDLFKWDSILFFFNKILLLLSIFSWIYKFDFSTVKIINKFTLSFDLSLF